MPKKYINFAIIGCGRISKKYLAVVKRIKQVKLYALCDINTDRLRASADDCGNPKLFSDYNKLLADKNIELLSICTPSGLHARMAIAAAKHKKHVILEKPIALRVSDAENILRAFDRSGTSLSIMLQNRTNPAILFLQKHKQLLGRLLYINAHTYWYRKQEYYDDGWHGTAKMDGGVLMNQGTHYVDMVQYLVGAEAVEVSAIGGTFSHKMECEDAISVNIKFASGVLANIQANTLSYPENFEGAVTLFYEKATVKIGGIAMNKIVYWKGAGEDRVLEFNEKPISGIYGDGHLEVMNNVVSNLLEGKNLFIPGNEGVASLKIIAAAYKSLKTKVSVTI